ncbi:MAG: DUF3570 domain-containing protein [Labilithrix sp.]|nr:DUF3570 domain-containing protein [Labilithrix sp.]
MQLRSASVALSLFFMSLEARAGEPVVRASSEIGAYHDSFATSVLTPSVTGRVEDAASGWQGQARYLVDVVTAASPDVVATASPRWSETRHAGSASIGYKPRAIGGMLSGSTSYTPDYLSFGIAATGIVDLDDKHWTLSATAGYARDTIGRTGTSFAAFSRTLETVSGALVASRVLGPRTLGVVVADVVFERGDGSKPYRYVPMFAPGDVSRVPRGASALAVASARIQARPLEQLPLRRERGALTLRIAHRFDGATLRIDERLYGDTWGMAASTTDVRALFDVGPRVVLGPTTRFHAQTAVGFYERAYTASGPGDIPALRTGDRELGALVAASAGGSLRVGLGGDEDPMGTWIGLLGDGTWTEIADALYVERRWSALGALTFEARF